MDIILKDKIEKLNKKILELVSNYGFRQKRKGVFMRKQGECIQHFSILNSKVRNYDQILIDVGLGFTYEKVNKICYAVKNIPYDSGWATAHIEATSLIQLKKKEKKELFRFFVDRETNIDSIVYHIFDFFLNYGLDYWDKYSSLEEFEKHLLSKDEIIIYSTNALQKAEWNLLAVAIILKNISIDEILMIIKDEYNLTEEELNKIRVQIEKMDKGV